MSLSETSSKHDELIVEMHSTPSEQIRLECSETPILENPFQTIEFEGEI